jgi:hypothetical protein
MFKGAFVKSEIIFVHVVGSTRNTTIKNKIAPLDSQKKQDLIE